MSTGFWSNIVLYMSSIVPFILTNNVEWSADIYVDQNKSILFYQVDVGDLYLYHHYVTSLFQLYRGKRTYCLKNSVHDLHVQCQFLNDGVHITSISLVQQVVSLEQIEKYHNNVFYIQNCHSCICSYTGIIIYII